MKEAAVYQSRRLNARAQRWLIVDDEADLSALLTECLAQLGLARVQGFHSPEEALAAFAAHPASVDLVVTDRDMPGIEGLELARRMRARSPRVKVVLVSANIDGITDAQLRAAGIAAVVAKPFSLFRLEAVVRAVTCEPATDETYVAVRAA